MLELLFAIQIFFSQPVQAAQESRSRIPIQVDISHEKYPVFFQKALRSVQEGQSECAKLVNRLFLARFGKMMFGDAWTLQLAPDNQEFLDLVWRLEEDQFIRPSLYLKDKDNRTKHFRKIYSLLDKEKHPIGVLGFMYKFSDWGTYIGSNKKWLPQSHVVFLAGRKSFEIKNDSSVVMNIEEILNKKYGKLLDNERALVNSRVPLSLELLPGGSYFYNDFLLEEHFKGAISGSLLEAFLRKDQEKREIPLLRPVSYSRISEELIREIEIQSEILAEFDVQYIYGEEFDSLNFIAKDFWTEFLAEKLNINYPGKSLLVPIPRESELVRG
ncbi:hypothetical protein K9M41_03640 [Candidatus Gracilibacteria bacterium]|nr:hypothetical protein [Candidatus Gracilibacteria bacterium]